MDKSDLLTAPEMAKYLGMSISSFYRQLREGYPSRRYRGRGVDPNQIIDLIIGGRRYFLKSSADALIDGEKK